MGTNAIFCVVGESPTPEDGRRRRARARLTHPRIRRHDAFILLEVLVTATLICIGVIGMARLQARTAIAQMESYQRTQALLLARDMADRVAANKRNAAIYVSNQYGTGLISGCNIGAGRDMCAWDAALRGESERLGISRSGTLRGGRGCIEAIDQRRYRVIVSWQGLVPTRSPATGCALDAFGPDTYRRAVSLPLYLADLDAA